MPVKKKAAPKKKGKPRRKTPKEPPHKHDKIEMKPHPYNGRGRPALYEDAVELETECNRYFDWIRGEKGTRKVKVLEYNKIKRKHEEKEVEEEYWIRPPERPARTGLILFLGFASHDTMTKQKEKGEDFRDVVTRAMARVEHAYENGLWDRDATRGAQFALSNMGWKNRTDSQQLDAKGNPVDPVPAAVISVKSLVDGLDKV